MAQILDKKLVKKLGLSVIIGALIFGALYVTKTWMDGGSLAEALKIATTAFMLALLVYFIMHLIARTMTK